MTGIIEENAYDTKAHTGLRIEHTSDRSLSNVEKHVLIHGMNTKKRITLNSLQVWSQSLPDDAQEAVRQRVVPALKRNKSNNTFNRDEMKAMKDLKTNRSIVIVPADKGQMTVMLNRADYMDKADQLLQDTTTYKLLQEDPTKQLENKINATLKKIRFMNQLLSTEQFKMKPQDSTAPRFNGLPEVHKEISRFARSFRFLVLQHISYPRNYGGNCST